VQPDKSSVTESVQEAMSSGGSGTTEVMVHSIVLLCFFSSL